MRKAAAIAANQDARRLSCGQRLIGSETFSLGDAGGLPRRCRRAPSAMQAGSLGDAGGSQPPNEGGLAPSVCATSFWAVQVTDLNKITAQLGRAQPEAATPPGPCAF